MAAKAVAKTTASKSFIDFKSVIFWVLAIVFFCYANSLTNDYNMDDEIVTVNHPLTSKGISAIPDILKSPYFQSDIYSYEYRPIVHISFAIEHQFLGQSPFVSHLINLLLYLLLIYVAFDLLKRLFPAINQTILAAIVLVFALHPTHTEVVASIKNRDEILALLFSFLAWREAIKFTTTKQWWRILLVVLLFNLAMGAKVTVLSFAIIIPISILLLNTGNWKVLLITFILSVSVVLWLQQLNIGKQIIFVLLNVSFSALILRIRNIEFHKFLSEARDDNQELKGTIELKKIFQILKTYYPYLLAVLFALSFFGFIYPSALGIIGVIFLMVLLQAFSKGEIKIFWTICLFLALISLAAFLPRKHINSILFCLIFIPIGLYYFKTISKNVLIAGFALLVLVSFVHIHSLWWITLVAVVYYYSTEKKLLTKLNLALIIVLTICLAYILISGKNVETIAKLLIVVVVASFSMRKFPDYIATNLYALCLIFLFYAAVFSERSFFNHHSKDFIQVIQQSDVNTSNSVNIVPTQTYRPVLFAEFPVNIYEDPLEIKIGTSAEVLLKYLKLTLIPYPLSFYYGYSEIKPVSVNNLLPIISIIIHALLLIAAALSFKRNKLISFGILLYLISIAPFSALAAPIPGVMADRYLFAPTLGFAMVVIGVITWLVKTDWHSKLSGISVFPKNARYVLGGLLLAYTSLTIARNNDWKDRLTLFRNDIIHVPNSAQAHNLLAYHLNRTAQEVTDPLERKKLMEEAVFHFQRATEIWSEFMNATYDLGRTHEQLGNWNQAIAAYKRTFEIDTSFSDAIFRMGIIYEAENKLDSAIIAYQFVTEDNPVNITAFNNLSYCYFKKQEYRNAIETGRRSSFYHPTNTDPIVNIGKTFLHIKENDSALYYFEKVYPNRADDKGLTEALYKLWNEKGNMERANFYYRRMQIMGMVR